MTFFIKVLYQEPVKRYCFSKRSRSQYVYSNGIQANRGHYDFKEKCYYIDDFFIGVWFIKRRWVQRANSEICNLMKETDFVSTNYAQLFFGSETIYAYTYTFYQCYEKCFRKNRCVSFQFGPINESGRKSVCTLFAGAGKYPSFKSCCPLCDCGLMKRAINYGYNKINK